MDVLTNLLSGFTVALEPYHLFLTTLGGLLGTIIGMLPGLGPATGVAVLLPMTFTMGPVASLITMCGIYYGAMFGGSRSSILINTPGDGAALAATFDGYPMAMKGRAEAALAISAIASFIGGIIATIGMVLLAVPVANFAIKFGAAEYALLMMAALAMTTSMLDKNVIKGIIGIIFGLMVGTVGLDAMSGVERFTFGVLGLQTGIDFLIVIIGLYALGEVFKSFKLMIQGTKKTQKNFGRIWISKEDWKRSKWPILRSAPIGFFVGSLPGAGGTMASLLSYTNEKQMSKHPEEFGEGAIEGLAAPESANNAASVGALIPMLTLGIPGSGTTAVMMGALVMLGIQPGPLLFTQQPELAWGLIASMFIGNVICAIVNIPLAGVLVRVLSVPPKILFPIVLGLSFLGVYAINGSVVDFYVLVIFGLIGYALKKLDVPTAPMILAVIVGHTMEQSVRQALTVSNGNFSIFFASGLAKVLILVIIACFAIPGIKTYRKNKKKKVQESA